MAWFKLITAILLACMLADVIPTTVAAIVKQPEPCGSPYNPVEIYKEGTVSSSNYPLPYDNGKDCSWQLRSGSSIEPALIIFNFFQTEACCDYVYIYNDDSTVFPPMVTLSGSMPTPMSFASSGQDYLMVRFNTSSSVATTGFTAEFQPGNPVLTLKLTTELMVRAAGCTANTRPHDLSDKNGMLTSPNFPMSYFPNSSCEWAVTSSYQHGIVKLTITHFYTELNYDFLYIYNGRSENAQRIAVVTGQLTDLPLRYSTSQRFMFLKFTSNANVQRTGFSATYQSLNKKRCGELLSEVPDDVSSPPAGWGPMCYVEMTDGGDHSSTSCQQLIRQLSLYHDDYANLLGRGGNFGCQAITTNDFDGAQLACADNYQHSLTMASVSSATKMVLCLRLPDDRSVDD